MSTNQPTAAQPIDLDKLPRYNRHLTEAADGAFYLVSDVRAALARQQPAASGAGEVAASIDTPEFRALLKDCEDGRTFFRRENARADLIAHIDALLAAAPAAPHAQAEPAGYLFGGRYFERGSPEVTYQIRKHGRALYAAPAPQEAEQASDFEYAALYRWLRDQNNSLEMRQRDKGTHNGPSCYHEVDGVRELKSGAELDAAIKAAMTAGRAQEAEQAAPAAVTDEKSCGWLAGGGSDGSEPMFWSLENAQRECDEHNDYERSRPDFELDNLRTPEPVYSRATLLSEKRKSLELQRVYDERGRQIGRLETALERAQPAAPAVTDAARDVLAERQRQVEGEGWAVEHDDAYQFGELRRAAACYALGYKFDVNGWQAWPWADGWWKPDGERGNLIKAGALILADIERIDRADLRTQSKE